MAKSIKFILQAGGAAENSGGRCSKIQESREFVLLVSQTNTLGIRHG